MELSAIDAIDDYRYGRLRAAREKLIGNDAIDARLLYVALHTRLQDLSTMDHAIAVATELQASVIGVEDRIQAGIYLSFILARTGDVSRAAQCIERTKALTSYLVSPPATLDSELLLAEAMILFMQHRVAESERLAWNAVYADLELGSRQPPSRPALASIEATKARALLLLGIIRGTQERYHEQYRLFREAMVQLRRSPTPDVYLTASLQANRSYHAQDLGMLGEIVELELVPHHEWPDDLTELRLEIARSLSYLYALRGDEELALHGFRKAAEYTQSDVNRLVLISDEAYISRQLARPIVLRAKLIESCALVDSVDWSSVNTERFALHAFAQELAYVDPRRAARYIEVFLQVGPKANPTNVIDRRAEADVLFSRGLVAVRNGRREEGRDALAAAHEIWVDIGFRWNATAAAIELAELTGTIGFANYAVREARQYPDSWLARRVDELAAEAS